MKILPDGSFWVGFVAGAVLGLVAAAALASHWAAGAQSSANATLALVDQERAATSNAERQMREARAERDSCRATFQSATVLYEPGAGVSVADGLLTLAPGPLLNAVASASGAPGSVSPAWLIPAKVTPRSLRMQEGGARFIPPAMLYSYIDAEGRIGPAQPAALARTGEKFVLGEPAQ